MIIMLNINKYTVTHYSLKRIVFSWRNTVYVKKNSPLLPGKPEVPSDPNKPGTPSSPCKKDQNASNKLCLCNRKPSKIIELYFTKECVLLIYCLKK